MAVITRSHLTPNSVLKLDVILLLLVVEQLPSLSGTVLHRTENCVAFRVREALQMLEILTS